MATGLFSRSAALALQSYTATKMANNWLGAEKEAMGDKITIARFFGSVTFVLFGRFAFEDAASRVRAALGRWPAGSAVRV